jgi:quinol monooxygenase YgiN
LLRALRDASRKEAGNSGFEVLQRKGQPQQFAVLEYWNDAKAQASHAAAAGTVQAVEKLNSYLAAPIDQRLLEKHEVAAHTRKFRDLLLPMSGSLYDQRLYQAIN